MGTDPHIVKRKRQMYEVQKVFSKEKIFTGRKLKLLKTQIAQNPVFTNSEHTVSCTTSTISYDFKFNVGNKWAHIYHGNIGRKSKIQPKHPCIECGKGVVKRSKAISCDDCDLWIHVKCTNAISMDEYDALVTSGDCFSFTCDRCTLQNLPYSDLSNDTLLPDSDIPASTTSKIPLKTVPDLSCFQAKGLHFIGLNIRSILPKLSELKFLVAKINPATISISETWIDDSVVDSEIDLPGYCIIRRDRNRHGGGVCLYIRADLSFNVRSDLNVQTLEAIWIDILLPKTKPILVASIYRPPNQQEFLDKFDTVLNQIDPNQEGYILGDFNICTKSKKSHMFQKYSTSISTASYTQIIQSPTRISQHSSTIDHILCSFTDKVRQSGVVHTSLSDHSLVYCTRKQTKNVFNAHNTVTIRSMKGYSASIYANLLEDTDWSPVLHSLSPDTAWSNFKNILSEVLDKVAPEKTIRIKNRTEPWMTPTILEKIALRDGLFYLYRETLDSSVKFYHNKLRNEIQRNIKNAKAEYLQASLEDNLGKPKKLWHHLKTLGYNNKTKINSNIVLKIAGKLCYDTQEICNYINTFFTTIASNLVKNLPSAKGTFSTKSDLFKSFHRSKDIRPGHFTLQPVSSEYVYRELRNLNPQKSTSLDKIAPKFLRDGAKQLAPALHHIMNLSITQNNVPEDLKHAKVTPLLRKTINRKLAIIDR